MDSNMEVIHGPIVPAASGLIYQITLTSGMIVTSPEGFGPERHEQGFGSTIVTADGRVLVAPAPVELPPIEDELPLGVPAA